MTIFTKYFWLDKQAGLEHVFDLPRKDFRVPEIPTQCRRKQRQISSFLKSVVKCSCKKIKKDVPLGVHAERQVGIVLIFAVVTVRIPETEFNVFYVYNTIIYCFYYSLIVFLDPENVYLDT